MAMQPVDRKKAKHAIKTSSRSVPSLVNRTNKTIVAELAPHHKDARFMGWFVNPFK